ncbi:hypothetical protein V8C42DRAFT_336870 [Trichoderma barbatum]
MVEQNGNAIQDNRINATRPANCPCCDEECGEEYSDTYLNHVQSHMIGDCGGCKGEYQGRAIEDLIAHMKDHFKCALCCEECGDNFMAHLFAVHHFTIEIAKSAMGRNSKRTIPCILWTIARSVVVRRNSRRTIPCIFRIIINGLILHVEFSLHKNTSERSMPL